MTATSEAPGAPHLLYRAAHAFGLHPLALLDVHRLAGASGRHQEIGLPAEECRDLEHVGHLGDGRGLVRLVDVGEHRQPARGSGPLQRPKPLVQPGPRLALEPGAVRLVEAGLEADRDAEVVLDARQLFGHRGQHVAGLDHTGPGDEKRSAPEGPAHQRVLRASSSAAARAGAAARRRMAAAMNPANSGCGRVGRDFSSGWNWQPMNQA